MVRFRADKEMKYDLSRLRETPVFEDGKQLFIQAALFDEGEDFAFATVIGPRDFYEAKGLSWPESARNAGITPKPGGLSAQTRLLSDETRINHSAV